MRHRWTLNVENFGKIEKASIEISPMMLFVGENNSGKSYMMSLLWGILTLGGGLIPTKISTSMSKSYEKYREWLVSNISTGVNEVVIDVVAQELFLNMFNDFLLEGKEMLVERIFNFPIPIGRIYISNYKRENEFKIVGGKTEDLLSDETQVVNNGIDLIEFPYELSKLISEEGSTPYFVLRVFCEELILKVLKTGYFGVGNLPLYLPASRTGFMLTYKTLLANMIDPTGFQLLDDKSQHYRSNYTLPVTRFLKNLVEFELNSMNQSHADIAGEIEKNILRGELKKDQSPVPNFLFQPKGSKTELPLHVTSSLVSELSPLIFFLRSNLKYDILIIEEPEAHLHPELQRMLATALVQLVNTGLPIWITTHSDTMFQQINNLIKLNNNPDNEQLAKQHGYNEDDFLDPSLVHAYQFSNVDGNTKIESLKLTQYGFVVPTFNETIRSMAHETYAFQEKEPDAD